MTLLVLDVDGVWHEVYNKLVIADVRTRRGDWIENWEVRTLCSKDEELGSLQAGIQRATLDDGKQTGHVATCVRCMAMPCDHGITFDAAQARRFRMTTTEIRERWPRLSGECLKGCGYSGVYYASLEHYAYGDW